MCKRLSTANTAACGERWSTQQCSPSLSRSWAISEKDVKLLWGRSAERCAFPECRKALSKTPEAVEPTYPLGKQAHIVSRAMGGVRDDPTLSRDERDSYANLILVCAEHHDVIYNEPATYTVAVLHQMKEDHERWVTGALATDDDLRRQAIDVIYATLVDSAVNNLLLESWSNWTAPAVASNAGWHEDLPPAIGSLCGTFISLRYRAY